MGLRLYANLIILYILADFVRANYDLKCYSCNSNYQQCNDGSFFNKSIQHPTYCYGRCLKMVIAPGNLIIRACTTFFASVINYTLSIDPDSIENQCYLATYHDPVTLTDRRAYTCFCQDAIGCNPASTIFHSQLITISLTILALVCFKKFT